MRRFAPYLLLILVVGLSALLYVELTQSPTLKVAQRFGDADGVLAVNRAHDVEAVRPASAPDALSPVKGGAAAFEPQFNEMVDRPLFRPDRRPAPPADEPEAVTNPVPAPKDHLDDFTLVGAILTEDEEAAFLRESGTGKLHIIRLGDRLRGYEATVIDGEGVMLRSGDDQVRFRLRE